VLAVQRIVNLVACRICSGNAGNNPFRRSPQVANGGTGRPGGPSARPTGGSGCRKLPSDPGRPRLSTSPVKQRAIRGEDRIPSKSCKYFPTDLTGSDQGSEPKGSSGFCCSQLAALESMWPGPLQKAPIRARSRRSSDHPTSLSSVDPGWWRGVTHRLRPHARDATP
jgi:hypothetical protein